MLIAPVCSIGTNLRTALQAKNMKMYDTRTARYHSITFICAWQRSKSGDSLSYVMFYSLLFNKTQLKLIFSQNLDVLRLHLNALQI